MLASSAFPDFPIPEWPPIQNVESVDVIGKKPDGGVEMYICASQPIDDSPETLETIRQKVAYYLDVFDVSDFLSEMEYPPRELSRIIIVCDFPIHPTAERVIQECDKVNSKRGLSVSVNTHEFCMTLDLVLNGAN